MSKWKLGLSNWRAFSKCFIVVCEAKIMKPFVYSSVIYHQLSYTQGHGGAGVYQSCYWTGDPLHKWPVHHRAVTMVTKTTHRFTPTGNLESPIRLIWKFAGGIVSVNLVPTTKPTCCLENFSQLTTYYEFESCFSVSFLKGLRPTVDWE